MLVEYKNLSGVWEWDRKICREDHRLSSQRRACQVMTKGDNERWICLSHYHMNDGFFILLTFFFTALRLPEVSENAEMQHDTMTSY